MHILLENNIMFTIEKCIYCLKKTINNQEGISYMLGVKFEATNKKTFADVI